MDAQWPDYCLQRSPPDVAQTGSRSPPWVALLLLLALLTSAPPSASAQSAALRPLSPFAAQFGNGCQTQVICAAIERLGLYVGLRLDGTATDAETGRELAFGGTFSLGLDLIRRVAIEASFPVGLIYRGTESTLFPVGPLRVGGRLRLGGAAPTLFSERPQPRLAWVLGAYVTLPLPSAAGDERHVVVLGVPQPEVDAGAEIRWGPVQLVPSIGALVAERAVYLHAGGRVSLSLSQRLLFELEAQSRIPVFVPDDAQSRCGSGTRVGLGLRGVLGKGVMGAAHYDHGSGDCEAAHRAILGVTFAFGEEPLRHIPTPEEAGVPRAWLGMVDPVLDCNGWMLDDVTLLPKFKFGDPDPQDPNLIRRGSAVFHVGEHFDIDRYGRVYRPHQYVALADEHEFTEAKTAEKLALPVCEFGPKHRFFERCQFLAHSVENLAEALKAVDEGHGSLTAQVREMQYEEECLPSDEREDPRLMFIGMLSGLRSRARPTVRPPPPPPIRKPPGQLGNHGPPNRGTSPSATSLSHAGDDGVQVTAVGGAGGGSAAPQNGHAPGVAGLPRTGSALKADPHHAFPDVVDNFARDAKHFEIPTRGPGGQIVRTSELYQVEGSLNQRTGVFEWIVDQGQITHRRFIPGGKVTGFPNQVPAR